MVLADPETAREMQCHMLETVDDGAQLYASMTPVDTPVAITALRENMMVEVDDPALLEALLPSAAAVCAEMGLTLMDTPVTLTVAGELPDPDDGDGGDGAAADGSGGDGGAYAALDLPEADDAEDDEDGAEVLLGFRHDDAQLRGAAARPGLRRRASRSPPRASRSRASARSSASRRRSRR